MTPTRKTKSHVYFAIQGNIRTAYTYELKLMRRSGKVVSLTAGCRTWPNVARAEWHYESRNDQPPGWVGGRLREVDGTSGDRGLLRWSDLWLSGQVAMFNTDDPVRHQIEFAVLYAQRAEARGILRRLRSAWESYVYKQNCRRANERRARKKARSRK